MDIEGVILIAIALALPIITEYRLRRMLKKMMNNPDTAKQVAKLIKQILKEYKNA